MNRSKLIRFGFIIFGVGLMCVGIARGLNASGQNVEPKDIKKAERQITPASGSDERAPLSPISSTGGNGIVEPLDREIKLAGETAGRIAIIHAKEGDFVEQGQLVAEQEHQFEDSALAAAEADVATATAELARTQHGLRIEDIHASSADARSAQEKAALSKSVFERVARLAKSGAATPDELDRAQRQAASDLSIFKSAKAREDAAIKGSRVEDIDAAKARLTAAVARRDQSRAGLERLRIKAPKKGEILQIKFRAGEFYNPTGTEPLLTMGDTSKLRVRLDIDERDINKVAIGRNATIYADAFPDKPFFGKIVELGRRMGRKNVRTDDPTERIDTKILEVVIDLADSSGLIPGLRVTGYIGQWH